MLLDLPSTSLAENDLDGSPRASVVGTLPAGLVFTQRAASLLRTFLNNRGLSDWLICSGHGEDIDDIDYHLNAVGDADAKWVDADPFIRDGESMLQVKQSTKNRWIARTGFLHLVNRQIVIARWFWMDADEGALRNLHLVAAPSVGELKDLRERMKKHRRTWNANVWQFVTGYAYADQPTVERRPVDIDSLIMADALKSRLSTDVVSFFGEPVAAMYRSLGVPYRRGILFHGPPGNGKTSIIRLLGAQLRDVPFMILRPNNSFDADDFTEIVRRWKNLAPAVMVVEDLNWLLKSVNISTFLNLLDGIDDTPNYAAGDRGVGQGLMLIATTNDPGSLDPAINNRPGRFDVVIEIASPASDLRERFVRTKLPELQEETVQQAVSLSNGFSFAHLQELLRQSGLIALADGRSSRSDADVLKAAEGIRHAQEQATRGFPPPTPDIPFGLQHLRTVAR